MADFINPLDIKKVIIDYFLGGPELLIFGLMILISSVCAKYQMNGKQYMVILAISSLIFAGVLGQAIYIIILLVIGLISFKSIARILT